MVASNSSKVKENAFEITTDVVLVGADGKDYVLSGANETVSLQSIIIYESLESPYLIGEMVVVDNGINLIGTLPIFGTEKITMGLKTPYYGDTEYKYVFHISAVRNRTAGGKLQGYTFDLISYEGLQNEALRIAKTYADFGDGIVKKILKDNFKTQKPCDAESCKYKMKFIPRGQRPFELIYSMLNKCVPGSASPSTKTGSTSSITTTPTTTEAGASDVKPVETLSGSAGYFFWESWDGYKFKSIDKLCEGPVKATYKYQIGKVDNGKDPGQAIIEYNYTNEIDVMKKMRYGTYSSMVVFFNPSTGQYEEYIYDLDKSYSGMKHLGKDEKLPAGPKALSKYPTRVMTQFLDHETFHDGAESGSPDPKDNNKSGGNFPDYKKHYMSQSISRKLLLENQQLALTVHGNLSLRAGDKVTILLPNFSVNSITKTDPYDKQHSGNYLIKEISYEFYRQKNGQGNIGVTNMTLVRDSFGSFLLEV
jgi:hypothetical protein